MKKYFKKLSILCVCILLVTTVTACNKNAGAQETQSQTSEQTEKVTQANSQATPKADENTVESPKYVFLFIGDGMSYPQVQTAAYYLGAMNSNGGVETQALSFMDFPVAGSAQTFDSTSFCPDSASTATSIATGNKTYSGTINKDITMTESFETISEKVKSQRDYKVGVISSVNLNHATPAAFYAHQESRGSYYEIGEELIASGFDYFAGGALLQPTGKEKDRDDLYELAETAGYNVIKTQAEAEKLTASDGKAIVIAEKLADADAMSYDLDAADDEWRLKDYVSQAIEMLDNDNGFFLMVEGGKVDWACHANDAAASINDTIALSNAVDEAIAFYEKHPDETLIIVTGDHETGGLTIGFAGTDYDTYLTNISNQKITYAKFDTDFVADYKENNTPFEDVLADVETYFGLIAPGSENASEDSKLILTDYEYENLKKAYERTMTEGPAGKDDMTQEEYVLYGSYEPLTVTITHILNNKSGINFASYAHTGLPVPVYAKGVGEDLFEGYYDNTDIYFNMAELLNVK